MTFDPGTLSMLDSILEHNKHLEQRIVEKQQAIEESTSETEKNNLAAELERLDKMLSSSRQDFERIATGVDISLFTEKKEAPFNWKDELVSLIKPGIMELKQATQKARQKADLKEELSRYQELKPVAHQANENLMALIARTEDARLKERLEKLVPEWKGQERQLLSRLEITQMQLMEMESEEKSILETSQNSIKQFFKTRGLFLFVALIACIGIVLLLRVAYLFLIKRIPGYQSVYRPFHLRAMDLLYRVVSVLSALLAVILVFYLFEDWVLLSLAIIFLLGLAWTVKNTLPRFVHQSRLILNIGAVREGERLVYQGVPWLVKKINFFSVLENPDIGQTLRLPIEELMDLISRPFQKHEPWFPCRKNDWVILSDGTRGCVTSLSHEMVELVLRGGAKKVYQTSDFLGMNPLNLSVNFRIKIGFGISYNLQSIATGRVLEVLDTYLRERLVAEEYEDSLLNLRVEFAQAGSSSLDLVVIADFDGKMAPLYNRISRAIQRWCTDACTANDWEIPFPQLTVHKPAA
ncbi:mechanosensitive ion channel family protein [Desulfotignum balticum]|uniref:mechanosensitive ion channel family protein n=1 Tax=Desulfotignum balticum TaxID=115781 RepID=UPI001FE0AE45|nr:mechanosensitive ion channel family protein [Desulfotignum balticum]